MASQDLGHQNIIFDLQQSSETGEAFSAEEIVDTAITLLVAGRITTADALPALLANLSEHPDFASRIAREPLEFRSIEEDSHTLRFVRESLRTSPPAGAYRRACCDPRASFDLGEHGCIPPGCTFAVHLRPYMTDMEGGFDPDRWTPELVRERFVAFGGSQPHACIGSNLALLELQLFARVLCREYNFTAVDTQLCVDAKNPMSLTYKDGLRIKISRKAQPEA